MAAMMVFTFDVAGEKQAEYIKATKETIKPFWESHGCQSYDIWQVADGGTAFMKIMLFADPDAMKKSTEGNAEAAKPVVQLWSSFATNVSIKSFVKKT